MGTVYLARDQRLGRQVALKVLNAEDLANEERRLRFMREARAAAAVRHQNVATIYEVDQTENGEPYIVMEYCEGETLSQRLRRRQLDTPEFLAIAKQITAGIAAAHENGVVHRDLKTANIIIEQNGLVKILDFGLAKLLSRELTPVEAPSFESTSGHFFGTLHYISPEQARGLNADERSDLFSLGILFYQMAAGHLPFNGDAPLLVLERIRDAEPEPFIPLDPAFPPSASRIISRLLQKDPRERYQSANDVLHDLEQIDTPTTRMTTTTTRTMLGRTRKGSHAPRIIVAVVAFLIVAVSAILVRRHNVEVAAAKVATDAASPIRSLAVLPLDNIANNTKDDFLSVGLADALVTKLQAVPALQVRPTSAVLEFRNHKVDAKTASEKLEVDGVLEGHFLAAGDIVRVTLQLTDARTGYNIWADTVQGNRDNLLKLIDDVSARTVDGLNQKLGHIEASANLSQPRSSNPKAYEQYLRARALNGSLVPKEYREQVAALERAIQLDPNFAAAYADLAIALSLGQIRGLNSDPNSVEKALNYAKQAVRIDPNLSQGHLALGRVLVRYPDRFSESSREVLASLRLNPNDTHALHSLTTYMISVGEMQKAKCIGDRLVRLDPSSNEAKTRGYWYINAIDPQEALRTAEVALASRDTELAGHDIRGVAYVMLGNVPAARKEAEAASALVPNHYIPKSLRAMIAAADGDVNGTEAAIRQFEDEGNRNHWAALRIALCYSKLGKRDQAILWLHRAQTLGNHSWYALLKHPWLQNLQTDPEYQAIIAGIKADLDDVRDDNLGVFQLLCAGQ